MDNKLSKLQIAAYRDRLAASDSEYEMVPVPTRDLRALLAAEAFRDQMVKYVRTLGSSVISPSVVETILNAAMRAAREDA